MTDIPRDLERAKCLEQAELYDDMKDAMKKVVISGHDLKTEDRNLLSVAYKNVVGKQRSVYRIISAKIAKLSDSTTNSSELEKTEAEEILKKTVGNLKTICEEVVELIEKHLFPNSHDSESKVFYCKMKGDYYRYLAEVDESDFKEKAGEAYEEAHKIATKELASTHPIRLGLALNYSVYFYEIKNESVKACELAKKAFDDAISDLDQLKEDSYKDSTLIMQLLRDNLTLWTADGQAEDEGD